MEKQVGLWIDHREATIVVLSNGRETTRHILSSTAKHIRYSGSTHSKTPPGMKEVTSEDQRDRKFGNQLNQFYDQVIAVVREADSIQIFGPGEAKGELEKRLAHEGFQGRILAVETTDKMTNRQIAAKVREQYQS